MLRLEDWRCFIVTLSHIVTWAMFPASPPPNKVLLVIFSFFIQPSPVFLKVVCVCRSPGGVGVGGSVIW